MEHNQDNTITNPHPRYTFPKCTCRRKKTPSLDHVAYTPPPKLVTFDYIHEHTDSGVDPEMMLPVDVWCSVFTHIPYLHPMYSSSENLFSQKLPLRLVCRTFDRAVCSDLSWTPEERKTAAWLACAKTKHDSWEYAFAADCNGSTPTIDHAITCVGPTVMHAIIANQISTIFHLYCSADLLNEWEDHTKALCTIPKNVFDLKTVFTKLAYRKKILDLYTNLRSLYETHQIDTDFCTARTHRVVSNKDAPTEINIHNSMSIQYQYMNHDYYLCKHFRCQCQVDYALEHHIEECRGTRHFTKYHSAYLNKPYTKQEQ